MGRPGDEDLSGHGPAPLGLTSPADAEAIQALTDALHDADDELRAAVAKVL